MPRTSPSLTEAVAPVPSGDLRRARSALAEAELADAPAERYLQAQLAALRVAAVVLAARAHAARGGGLRNVWQVVAEVAPEHAEWAGYFAATQAKRQAVQAGVAALVSPREADDLIREARAFHDDVTRWLTRRSQPSREVG